MSKYTETMRDVLSTMVEGFSKKEIKMAIGIASDPRYKGGNYTGAYKQIEKIKKGLASHPQVAAVLKRQNTSFDPEIAESGHDDVKSAKNQVQIAMSALEKMNTELGKLKDEDSLPTWWTNKVAVSVDKLDGMADYLDTQVEEVELNENKLTYVEYKFKNKNEAMKAKEMLLKSFNEVDDEDINRGIIIVDAGNRDMTKQHNEIMKTFRPKVIETRKLGLRREEVELDEAMKYTHAVVDPDGKVAGMTTDERDAKDIARRHKGKVVKLKKPIAQKVGDMMINRSLKEKVEVDEGYKPVKANHYDVKVTVKDRDVAKVKKIISNFNGDIEDVDSDQVDGGGNKFKGTGDIFIQGEDAGKLGLEIAKAVRTAKVMGEGTVVESWELDEMKMDDPKLLKIFDKLKKGSTVKIKIDSAVSKGKDYREFTVTAKNIVGKGKKYEQEKITLKAKDNPTGVKHFLYNRDGKVTLAIGDMGASIADIKEDNMSAYTAAITKGVK